MVYVVKYKSKIKPYFCYKIVNKGFSCKPEELKQELITHIGIDKKDFVDYKMFDSVKVAKEIIKYKSW